MEGHGEEEEQNKVELVVGVGKWVELVLWGEDWIFFEVIEGCIAFYGICIVDVFDVVGICPVRDVVGGGGVLVGGCGGGVIVVSIGIVGDDVVQRLCRVEVSSSVL